MMPQFSFYLLKALSRLRKYSFPIIAAWILLLHRHDSPFGEKWNERKHNDSDIWSSADDRIRFILNKEDKDRIAEFIRVRHPRWAKSSIKRADNILSHVITILGKDFNVGKDVEWHKDFQSGYTWPLNDYRRFREQLTPKGTDVKIPWELSRFHQGLLLGKAYAITKDEIYAEEFAAEFCDWVDKNPPFRGVNWSCTMEVGIRAANLIWTMTLLQGSRTITQAILDMFHRTLYLHGFYIFNNLEKNIRLVDGRTKEVNGNHFVCDIVGLLYTAITLKSIKDARKWLSTAIKGIDGIIHDQICDDGVHYEFSPNYHRLVLEAILYAIDLMKAAGIDPGSDIIQKVALMLDFVRYYLKPDGEAPLIRDIDNGRFIVLGDASLTSHRHVLAMGRALINGIKFDDWMSYEDVLWLHSDKSYSKELWKIKEGIKGNESRAYISSGLYILRSRRIYTFIICSSNGMHGYCGHAHNDLLSYELTIDGTDFLTDSGSYLYTRWPEWRNRFRSTEYHNSAIIDDQETNDIPLGDLFMLGNAVMPKVTYWHSDSTSDMLEAEYTVDREGTQVNHKRYFKLYKKRDCLRVHDLFTGEGVHTVRIPLNFGVNIVISRLVQNTLLASKKGNGKKNALLLIAHANKDMNIEIKSGWLSKVYGRKDRRKVALLSFRGELPIEVDLNILYLQDARHLPHTRSNVKCEVAIREAIIKCHEKMKYNRLD